MNRVMGGTMASTYILSVCDDVNTRDLFHIPYCGPVRIINIISSTKFLDVLLCLSVKLIFHVFLFYWVLFLFQVLTDKCVPEIR